MRRARYAVAKTSDIVPDTATIVRVGSSGECTLFHHQGSWYATGSLCPHQNAPLDGAGVEDHIVVCHRHGYRFDLKTGDCVTAGGYGLPVFPVDVEDGTVYVTIWEFD